MAEDTRKLREDADGYGHPSFPYMYGLLKDNGIGWDPDADMSGNGIKNIRQRVRLLNGKLTLETEKPKGMRWNLVVDC